FTVITGLILTIRHGWPVLALGVFGVASAVFYTAPPIRFGYRGWGEVIMFVNFGPTLTLGAYYVQAGGVALEPLIVSLVPGLLMWSLIIINEIPDYEADRSGGKTNLVVRWGRERAVLLYLAGLGGAFTIVFTAVATGLSRPLLLLALVGLPWAVSSLGILKDHLYDPRAMAPANRAMLITYTVTITGLIGAYTIPLLF
ncbi:MAG: prenyltransferase, partial [Syntrophales bacterium]|nr:prenyltransferase [Syntrophales bacterium]